MQQIAWWKANGVYPIHFVWETGLGTALWDALRRWASGGRRGWVDEAKDTFLEVAARLLGGGGIWNDMKVDAAAASVKGGGGYAFVRALGKWMTEHPGEVEVHAVGHSAGSIFHSHLLPAALEADVPEIASLSLLAPAVRVDTFTKLVLPHARSGKIERLAIFTMDDDAERADTCLRIYNKSLLYLVSASFEPQKATPILGMAKFLTRDVDLADFFTGASAQRATSCSPRTPSGCGWRARRPFARRLRQRRAHDGERRASCRGRQPTSPRSRRGGRAPSSRGPSTRTCRRRRSAIATCRRRWRRVGGRTACALHRRRRVPRRGRPPAGLRRRRARLGRGVPQRPGST